MEDEKKSEYDDPEQSARFIEIAERISDEDAEEKFEEAIKRILTEQKAKKIAHRMEKSSTKA